MIKSILVPMGASRFSLAALETAARAANVLKAQLTLLYVEDTAKIRNVIMAYMGAGNVSLDVPERAIEEKELEKIEAEMEKEKSVVQGYYDEVKPSLEVEHRLVVLRGPLDEVILSEIRKVDLVVMGKSLKEGGECGAAHSPILKIIRHSNKSILAVCSSSSLDGQVLVCYDGSRSANNALRILTDFAPVARGAITVLTVAKSEEDARPLLDEAADYFKSYGLKVEKLWKSGKATEVIVATAKEKGASLILMGGYGDNKFKELLVGSTTEKVFHETDAAVLLSNW